MTTPQGGKSLPPWYAMVSTLTSLLLRCWRSGEPCLYYDQLFGQSTKWHQLELRLLQRIGVFLVYQQDADHWVR